MKSARETALNILYEIEENGAYSNILLKKVLGEETLSSQDKALVTELVMGVVKYKKRLDYQISTLSKIKMKKISKWILNILRMGIYQIQFTRIPMRAAVDESVRLAGRYGHQGSKGFVNAVLRKSENPILPDKENEILYLSTLYSYPEWMVEKWLLEFGPEKTEEILSAGNEIPPIAVRRNLLTESSLEELEESGITPVTYFMKGSVGSSEGFKKGAYTVQDTASQLVAYALNPQKGERVLDVCAAPGGKTTHIAERMENEGEIIACDIYEHKLQLIETAAERLHISIIKTAMNDAGEYNKSFGEFDKVLVDAPCSGLGIIRRKPDIKWNRTRDEIRELALVQRKILTASAKYVKSGGTLLYSTCTITPEENHKNVEWFLKENPDFSLSPFGVEFPIPELREKSELQLYPGDYKGDGFYICRMIRA